MLTSMMSPYYSLVFFAGQFLLALLAAIVSAILAYGAIAATIIGLLGPIFVPFLVFDKLDWSFWGWPKAYLGFSFYKVVAAATPAASGKALRVHQHADTVLRSAQVHLAAQRNLGLHSGPEGVDVAVSLTR